MIEHIVWMIDTSHIDYFKIFTVEVRSVFRSFPSRREEREIFNFWKKNLNEVFRSMLNFLLSQLFRALHDFSQFWTQKRITVSYVISLKWNKKKENATNPHKKLSEEKSEIALKRRTSKRLIFKLFLLVPVQRHILNSHWSEPRLLHSRIFNN